MLVQPPQRVVAGCRGRSPVLRCTAGESGGRTDWVAGALKLVDGRLLSWSGDCTLRLWSADGAPLLALVGHTKPLEGALALADGRMLSLSDDSTLRLWSADGWPLATMAGHTQQVQGALVLADGRMLSWSKDHTLRLWSADGSPLATLDGHMGWVQDVLALADGRMLSWSHDSTLRLWSADGAPLVTLAGHRGSVNGALVLADGRMLSWSRDRTLRLWSVEGAPLAMLNVGFSDTNNWEQTIISVWAWEQGFDANAFFAHLGDRSVTGGRAAYRGNTLYIYDWTDGHTLAQFIGDAKITSLNVLPHDVIAAGDIAGRVIFLHWLPPEG